MCASRVTSLGVVGVCDGVAVGCHDGVSSLRVSLLTLFGPLVSVVGLGS